MKLPLRTAVAAAVLVLLAGCGGLAPVASTPSGVGVTPSAAATVSASASREAPVVTPEPVSCPPAGSAEEPAAGSGDGDPEPAVPAVLGLFDDAPIVAIGEYHGWPALHEFLGRLICDPGFPGVVDAIVVEFGNSRLQPILDRYVVSGEAVPRSELQSVWRESTQRSGVWEHPVYERFFGLVRSVNARLPAAQRVRVLAGDPPIDYATVTRFHDCASEDPACLDHWLQGRDESFATVVADEVLERGKTALLVAGLGHVVRRIDEAEPPSIPDLLEALEPGSTRVVVPHRTFAAADAASDARVESWPAPAAALLSDSWLGELEACVLDAGAVASPDAPPCPGGEGPLLRDVADLYLYVGPG